MRWWNSVVKTGLVSLMLALLYCAPAALAVDDVTPPTIAEVAFDRQGQTLRPGDTVTLSARINDESGVSTEYSRLAEQSVAFLRMETGPTALYGFFVYQQATGLYTVRLTIPEGAVSGKYGISSIHVYDVYGNAAYLYSYDTPDCYFYVSSEISDVTPPTIAELCFDKQGQTIHVGDTVILSARLRDESGISTSYSRLAEQSVAFLRMETGPTSLYGFFAYQEATGLYTVRYTIPEGAVSGKYGISSIHVYDAYGNAAYLYSHDTPDCYFYVDSAINDVTPPAITELSFNKQGQTLVVGDTVTLSASLTDKSGISTSYSSLAEQSVAFLRMETGPTSLYGFFAYQEATGRYAVDFTIPEGAVSGKYIISSIHVYDAYGNAAYRYSYDTPDCFFYVTGADHIWLDADLGFPGNGKATGLVSGTKYVISGDSLGDSWEYLYRINADGTVGERVFLDTPYEAVQPLTGTEIVGLVNGAHYTIYPFHGPTDSQGTVRFPNAPGGSDFDVFHVAPMDSLYSFLQSIVGPGYNTLGIYDIYCDQSLPPEGIDVCFSLGIRYAGETVRIDHYHDGQSERYAAVVDQYGVATIRVYRLSPFVVSLAVPAPVAPQRPAPAIPVTSQPATPIPALPQTGDDTPLTLYCLLLFAAALLFSVLRAHARSRVKSN